MLLQYTRPPRHINEWTVYLTEAPTDMAICCIVTCLQYIKEWMVSLTEAEPPANIAFWNMETHTSPHHIKEWTVSLTEAEVPVDITICVIAIYKTPSPHQGMDGFSNRS